MARRGKHPLVASVCERNMAERVSPLSSRLCGKKHNGEGVFSFSSHLCGKKHNREGKTPSHCVSGGSRQPLPTKMSAELVFEGGGLVVVAAVSTTLENECLSSFLRAVVGGVPV